MGNPAETFLVQLQWLRVAHLVTLYFVDIGLQASGSCCFFWIYIMLLHFPWGMPYFFSLKNFHGLPRCFQNPKREVGKSNATI